MNTRLIKIQDWSELIRQTNWSVTELAKFCQVSPDTLRRHFLANMGTSPRLWMAAERQRQALELLHNGSSIKETAACLGYKQQTNFTRKFKEHWGVCPSAPSLISPSTARLREND